ncbi:MAG: radical SAM protein [Smithella sp.]
MKNSYLLISPRKLQIIAQTSNPILADIATFPVGLAYVSSAMKRAGFEVYTINPNFLVGNFETTVKECLIKNNVSYVCTGGTSLDVQELISIITFVRQIKADIKVIVGGPIISADPDTAMKVLGADIGVIGEGEETICDLATKLNNGESIDTVEGIVYFENDVLKITPTRHEIKDLNKSPWMDFDGWAYSEWLKVNNYSGIINSARSCPYKCTFCFKSTGKKYRQRTLDSVFEEIDYQINHYNISALTIIDELFAVDKKRVLEFCTRIKKYNMNWGASLRVSEIEPELLKLMKSCGCTGISTGLESGAQEILDNMHKNVTVKQLENALRIFADSGMVTLGNFIFGDMAETKETVKTTIALWERFNKDLYMNLGIVATFPGSPLYHKACEKGIIKDKQQYLKNGSFIINTTSMSDGEYYDMLSQIAELGFLPQAAARDVAITEVGDECYCRVKWTCRRCNAVHTLTDTHFLQSPICTCTCGVHNTIEPFRDLFCSSKELFAEVPAEEEIAFWGVGSQYCRIARFHAGFDAERFIQVDGNEHQQKMTRLGKKIYNPEIIITKNIKTVIITSPIAKNEILKIIKNGYPSVTKVFFPDIIQKDHNRIPVFCLLKQKSQ